MGTIVRQSVLKTTISYIGIVLGFIITIWLYPHFFTAEQYGLTRVLLSISMVIIQLASLGTDNTITRYFPFFRNRDKQHHGFLPIILIIPFIGFLLTSGILFLGKNLVLSFYTEHSKLLLQYYNYLFPLAFFILFFKVIERYAFALHKTVASSFLHDIFLRLIVIGLLFAYFEQWITFPKFIFFFVSSYAINLLLLALYVLYVDNIGLGTDLSQWNFDMIRNMVNYGSFSFLGNVTTVLMGNIDIIMLSALAGLRNTGIYAIAFYIGSSITIPRQSILSISSPMISEAMKNNNIDLAADIYQRSALNLLIIGGLLFAGIIANLYNLNHILPPAFTSGSLVIITIASANYFEISTGINGAIILNSEYYRIDLLFTVSLIILTIFLNLLFIPVYGMLGAAIGIALATVIYNAVKVIYIWNKFSIHPLDKRMLPALFLVCVTIYLSLITARFSNPYIDIAIRSSAISIFYLGIIRLLNLSTDINNLMDQAFYRLRKLFI